MIRFLVGILIFVMNTLYRDRPIPRFYVLEIVARVPSFPIYLSFTFMKLLNGGVK